MLSALGENLRIVHAQIGDISDIEQIFNSSIKDCLPETDEVLTFRQAVDMQILFAIKDNYGILGYFILKELDDITVQIVEFGVFFEYERAGIGTFALDYIHDHYHVMKLSTKKNANFFINYGFIIESKHVKNKTLIYNLLYRDTEICENTTNDD